MFFFSFFFFVASGNFELPFNNIKKKILTYQIKGYTTKGINVVRIPIHVFHCNKYI